MFFYINIRIFKIKLDNYISLAINSLSSLKYKQVKVYYNILNFEFFLYKGMLLIIAVYTLVVFL